MNLQADMPNIICSDHIVICVDKYPVNNKYCDIITDDIVSALKDGAEIIAITEKAYQLLIMKQSHQTH